MRPVRHGVGGLVHPSIRQGFQVLRRETRAGPAGLATRGWDTSRGGIRAPVPDSGSDVDTHITRKSLGVHSTPGGTNRRGVSSKGPVHTQTSGVEFKTKECAGGTGQGSL